jgi:hypothetical protein
MSAAIFISHSSKDNAWAERIRVWLDQLAGFVFPRLLEDG